MLACFAEGGQDCLRNFSIGPDRWSLKLAPWVPQECRTAPETEEPPEGGPVTRVNATISSREPRPAHALTFRPRWLSVAMQREGAKITLCIHPDLFSALRAGFEASACDNDPPIKSKLISPLRLALANADAKAPRGRLILVMLESIEAIPATASRKRIAASASGRRSRSARCGRGCEPGGSNAAAGAIFRRPLLSTFESPQQAGGKAGRSQALQTSLPRSSLLWRLPQQAKPSFPSIRRFESACTRFPR